MLPLELFRRRNFSAGNIETFAMYAGLSILFFFLVLFLQQVADYSALEAGLATLPTTIVMFLLSKRAGALADRHGPRLFMGVGPILAAAGLLLMVRLDADVDYVTELLPALIIFSVGLTATVAPLTATVLADADEENAGIASGVNNAIARAAGLLGIAVMGALVASSYGAELDKRIDRSSLSPPAQAALDEAEKRTLARADTSGLPPDEAEAVAQATEDAAVDAFQNAMFMSAVLVGLGGVIGLLFIVNPRRPLRSEGCAGGQLVGAPAEAGQERVPAGAPA